MKAKWIEPAKTATLILLVTVSFVLTGYLWFSSPAYEEMGFNPSTPPHLFSDQYDQYNNRDIFLMTAPHRIILHRNGKGTWLLPEDPSYVKLIRLVREADLSNDTPINPTPDVWKNLFLQSTGIELLFSEDVSISNLDAFFKESLWQKPYLSGMTDISRIWVFTDPANGQSRIWFISDARQKIVQLDFQPKDGNLNNTLASISAGSSPELVPVPLGGKAPGDPAAASEPFARIAWLPAAPVQKEEFRFKIGQINISDMIQLLFRNPDIEPIKVGKEYYYMYNDQLLRYHPGDEFMVYNDVSGKMGPGSSMRNVLTNINHFVQQHRGWSGNFLLDRVNKTDDGYQYMFRLFYKGIPVYWKNATTIQLDQPDQPDQIELKASENGVSEYSRSMRYLSGDPKPSSVKLPGKDDLLKLLSSKGISTDKVERIFPGYEATYTTRSAQEAILKPAWVIVVHNQPPILLSASS
jgi:regulatory protein YycH of two-component signal transduction system YycFG